jgi:hypothetical protein
MGKVLIVIAGVVLLTYALFDVRATPSAQVDYVPKFAWYLVVLIPYAGPLLWLTVGRGRMNADQRRGGPIGPDDDPDFLRKL